MGNRPVHRVLQRAESVDVDVLPDGIMTLFPCAEYVFRVVVGTSYYEADDRGSPPDTVDGLGFDGDAELVEMLRQRSTRSTGRCCTWFASRRVMYAGSIGGFGFEVAVRSP